MESLKHKASSYCCCLLVAGCIIIISSLASCKHGDNGSPDFGQGTGHCRLIAIDHPNYAYYGTTQLSYDSQNRVSQITNTGIGRVLTTFSYHDSIVIVSYSNGVKTTYRDSIVLNARGQISYDAAGFPPHLDYERTFSYDNQGHITHYNVRCLGTTTGDSYFIWANGNMITHSFGVGKTRTIPIQTSLSNTQRSSN